MNFLQHSFITLFWYFAKKKPSYASLNLWRFYKHLTQSQFFANISLGWPFRAKVPYTNLVENEIPYNISFLHFFDNWRNNGDTRDFSWHLADAPPFLAPTLKTTIIQSINSKNNCKTHHSSILEQINSV